jgi:hypothetical protein
MKLTDVGILLAGSSITYLLTMACADAMNGKTGGSSGTALANTPIVVEEPCTGATTASHTFSGKVIPELAAVRVWKRLSDGKHRDVGFGTEVSGDTVTGVCGSDGQALIFVLPQ